MDRAEAVTGRVLLEIAIGSVDDALAAQVGGADRLELNCALPLGGLTPSLGLLAEVKRVTALPVLAMLRPRPGGCCYSHADFRVIRRDLDLLLAHGADGIVFGVLTDRGEIDMPRCRELVRQCGSAPTVFHRAFDLTPDPFAALKQLIDLGVRRLMTSGQQATAPEGARLITELAVRAAGGIEILPAGGIKPANVAELLARTGCNQIHAGLRRKLADPSAAHRPDVSFSASGQPEDHFDATDAEAAAAVRALLP